MLPLDVTFFERESEGLLLRDFSAQVAKQALEQMREYIHQPLG